MSRAVVHDTIVVVIGGAIDRLAADQGLDELHRAGDSYRLPVVLDLREVTYLDPTGILALFLAQRELVAAGRSLTISEASGPVRRLLELSGTAYLFRTGPADVKGAGLTRDG